LQWRNSCLQCEKKSSGQVVHFIIYILLVLAIYFTCLTDYVHSELLVYVVGIAVDGDSKVDSAKPMILVKRSGKVVELEQDIKGLYIVHLYTGMTI